MSNKEKFWDRIAKNYDQGVDESDVDGHKIIELTKKYLQKNSIVLDYACATGKFAFELVEQVQEIHGIDLSSEMISIAQEMTRERNLENIYFSQGTLDDTHYKDESFDVVLALNIFHLLEDPAQATQKIHKLLKPGGVFISATAYMGNRRSFLGIALKPLSKLGLVPYINFFQPTDLEEIISAGNFTILEKEKISDSPVNIFITARKNQ